MPPQIKGLPPGATVEPIQSQGIQGLPPGATVEPIAPEASPPTLTGMAPPTSLPTWEDIKHVAAHLPLGALKSAAQTLFGTESGAIKDEQGKDTGIRPLFVSSAVGLAPFTGPPAPEAERQKFYQNIKPQGVPEQLGAAGEQAAEMSLTGGPLKSGAQTAASKLPFLQRILQPTARVAAESANTAANAAFHGQDPKTAALFGAGGQTVNEVLPAAIPFLRRSAETQYSKVLNPTTQRNKNITQQVVPQLIDRNVVGTEGGLLNKATRNVESLGPKIDVAVKNVPSSVRPDAQNVINSLENYKKGFYANGVAVDATAVKHVEDLQNMITDLATQPGQPLSYQSLNKARQILDKGVAQAGGYAGKTLSEGSMIDAQREAANAIRAELSRQSPDISKINAEFHLWKGVQDVMSATAERRTGQAGGLIRNMLPFLAGSAGLAHGGVTPRGGIESAAGMVLMVGIDKGIKSGLFRTMSAVSKARLADLMGSGKTLDAINFLDRLSAAGASQIPQQPNRIQNTPQVAAPQQ